MTTSEKIVSLQKHLDKTKHQLNGPLPEKRKVQEEQYKAYLKLEIKRTEKKIDDLKFASSSKL